MNIERMILDMIGEAKIRNVEIVKIGIPKDIQQQIISEARKNNSLGIITSNPSLLEIYGIPVEESETLQITTKYTGFRSINV